MAVEDIVIRMRVEGEEELQQMLQISGMSMKQFNKQLRNNAMLMTKSNQVVDRLSGKQLKLGNVMRQGMYQARRFKMEWLSIMFAGMALSRAFGGIVKAQFQLYGVTDSLSAMWTTVMSPAMDMISEKLYDLIERVMELPLDTQMTVGLTVLGLTALGYLVAALGQVFLAVMGLKLLFPKLAGTIAAAGGGILGVFKAIRLGLLGIGSTFLIVGAIVAMVAIGMYLAWKENFMKMKQIVSDLWSGIKQIFGGIIQFFKGALQIIVGIFTGNFDMVKEGFMNLLKGFVNTITGLVNVVMSAVMAITVGVIRIVAGIIQTVINAIIALANVISRLFGGKGKIRSVDILGWLGKLDATAPKIPKWQTGGLVVETGPAILHRGERVIPKGRTGGYGDLIFTPTVYINASISNDMDIRSLATKLNEFWVRDFERIAQTRGR